MKVKLPNGEEIEAEPIEIVEEKIPWTVLKLSDGSTLRMRINIKGILRMDAFNMDGMPVYRVVSDITMRTHSPPELRAESINVTGTAIKDGKKGGIEVR